MIALNNLILDLKEQSGLMKIYTKDEADFYENGLYILKHFAQFKSFTNNERVLSKVDTLASRRTFNTINTNFKNWFLQVENFNIEYIIFED